MKVWHITSEASYPGFYSGGMGVHVWNLTKEQARLGHEVTLFCPIAEKKEIEGVKIEPLETRLPIGTDDLANRLSASKLEVRKLFRKAKQEGVPNIFHGHEWDVADVYSDLREYLQVPTFATMHISNFKNMAYMNPEFTATAAYYLWWEQEMLRVVDGMIAISEHMAGYYRFCGCKCPIKAIHNGITVGDFETEEQLVPGSGVITAFWHGRFVEQKGLDLIIEVAETCPDIRFILAGDCNHEGEEYYRRTSNTARLKKLAECQRVSLVGAINQKEIGKFLRSCDVAVYPHHNAPFDLAVLEAMACGARVVTTGVDAIAEYTTDGVDCLYTAPTAKDLADTIRQAVKMEGMGERAAERARKMTWAKTAQETVEFYEEVISGNAHN